MAIITTLIKRRRFTTSTDIEELIMPVTLIRHVGRLAVAFSLALLAFYPPQASAQVSLDQQQVIQATLTAIQAKNASCGGVDSVTQIALVNGYALTTWLCGKAGGQALLTKGSTGWSVSAIHGGHMDASILVAFGVPSTTASNLEAALGPVPTPTP